MVEVAPVAQAAPVVQVAPVVEAAPVIEAASIAPVAPVVQAAPIQFAAAPQVAPMQFPAAPQVVAVAEAPPVTETAKIAQAAPAAPVAAVEKKREVEKVAVFHGGELSDHAMMLSDDVKVEAKKKVDPLPMTELKKTLTENKEYKGDIVWPTLEELTVPEETKVQYADW